MDDLGVVILNWNTRDLLRNCLNTALASTGGLKYRACVVDNASTDGSAEMVRAEFPSVELVESPANVGYAAGNNLGLRVLGFETDPARAPRHALLLNPDTEVPETALSGLVGYLDAHSQVGCVGPRLVLPDGSLDLACRRSFPTPAVSFWRMTGLSRAFPHSRRFGRYNMTYLDESQEAEVDSVVGACMLVRGAALAEVGLLDEHFWMYGEDLDWALRLRQAGWKVMYYPGVTVRHMKRAASRQNPRAQVEFYRAMRLFFDKHYRRVTPLPLRWLVLSGIAIGDARSRLRLALHGPSPAPMT